MNMFDVIREPLISEIEFIETNCKRFQEALIYIKKLVDVYGGMYLIIHSLLEKNNIITVQIILI